MAFNMLPEWRTLLNDLFPIGVPTTAIWTDREAIIEVLKRIGSVDSLNHTFHPRSGGLDLTDAKPSHEEGCIELSFGGIAYVIRPARLYCETFGESVEWAYFRLETADLAPSGTHDTHGWQYEEVTELSPGQYVLRSVYDAGVYGSDENGRDRPLPRSARPLGRVFSGAFVIFCKTSPYNLESATYDGRHNKVNAPDFRTYIERQMANYGEFVPQ